MIVIFLRFWGGVWYEYIIIRFSGELLIYVRIPILYPLHCSPFGRRCAGSKFAIMYIFCNDPVYNVTSLLTILPSYLLSF